MRTQLAHPGFGPSGRPNLQAPLHARTTMVFLVGIPISSDSNISFPDDRRPHLGFPA